MKKVIFVNIPVHFICHYIVATVTCTFVAQPDLHEWYIRSTGCVNNENVLKETVVSYVFLNICNTNISYSDIIIILRM